MLVRENTSLHNLEITNSYGSLNNLLNTKCMDSNVVFMGLKVTDVAPPALTW